jgi:hypothetical protein
MNEHADVAAPLDLFSALAVAPDGAMEAHLDANPPEEFALRFMQGLRRITTPPRWMLEISDRAFTSIWAMTAERSGPLGDGEIVDGATLFLLRGPHRLNAPIVSEAMRTGLMLAQTTGLDMLVIHYTVVTQGDAPLKMPTSVYMVALDERGAVVGASGAPAAELGLPDTGVTLPPSGAFTVLEVHTSTGCARAASQVVDGRAVGPVWLAPEGRSAFATEARKARSLHAQHGEVL